jgi:hypothetical protein
VNKYLIVLIDYSDGLYHVASRPKYVTDDIETAEAAANLLNEVANYKDHDEDGEWWGDHYAVRTVAVWGADGGA